MAHKQPEPDNAEARPTAKEVQVFVRRRRRVPAGILLPLPAAPEVMDACVQEKLRRVKVSFAGQSQGPAAHAPAGAILQSVSIIKIVSISFSSLSFA